MGRRNRQCICCSEQYSYCPTCSQDKMKPSWLSEFCSEDCKELWLAATKFNMGLIEKNEAKNIISALSLKDKSRYVGCVQHDLEVIFAEPVKRGKRIEVKPIDEACNIKLEHEVVTQEDK